METKPARIAASVAASGLMALAAGATFYHRHHDRAAPPLDPVGRTAEPGSGIMDRTRARAVLQQCVKQAERAARSSWDGMCASLAQRNAEQRDSCRQQGRTAADCLSLYAETPVQDCLLPHATASSIAQAQQTAKSDCYQQFQSEMQ